MMAGRPLRRARLASSRRNPAEVMTESGAWVVPVAPALRTAVETWLKGGTLSADQVKLIKKHGANPKGKLVDAAFWAGEIVPEMTRREIDSLIRGAKANPAGWMQEESSAAVRRAIQTRHPADIQRARDLQMRNERARDKERHGRKRNPGYSDADLFQACNTVSRNNGNKKGPILSSKSSGATIARWLKWNDPDGSYAFVKNLDHEDAVDVLRNSWAEEDVRSYKSNPKARKNGTCACGCGGACGKKNPRKNPVITWDHMNHGGNGHVPNDKNTYTVKYIRRSDSYPEDGYRVMHDNYFTKISRDSSDRLVNANGDIVRNFYPSVEQKTFFRTMEGAMAAAELHAMKHPVAAPVPKVRKTRASKAK